MSEKHETNTEHLYRLAGAEGGNEACLTKMMKIPRIHRSGIPIPQAPAKCIKLQMSNALSQLLMAVL